LPGSVAFVAAVEAFGWPSVSRMIPHEWAGLPYMSSSYWAMYKGSARSVPVLEFV